MRQHKFADRHREIRRGARWMALATLLTVMPALIVLGGCPDGVIPPPGSVTSIALAPIAEGLTSPLAVAVPPDGSGRLFVVDQIGTVWIIDSAGSVLPDPFLDLRDRLVELMPTFDERGLLSLAFHPDYAGNGRFFVFYTAPKDEGDPEDFDSESRVSEFQVSASDPDRADANSEQVLLEINKPQFNHNGGQLAFGPDGCLYVSVGDGGAANDVGVGHTPVLGNGQDLSNLLGTILRITVDSSGPFGIPADNPFVGDPAVPSEIWAYGLRNPWRFSFDTGGDNRLFCADVGQDLLEEVNIIEKGGNYGWNIKEGSSCFDPAAPGIPPATCASAGARGELLVDPIIEYPHADSTGTPIGVAVIGGFVYRGSALPKLVGDYIFGDFSTGFTAADGVLFAASPAADGTWERRELSVDGAADGRLGKFVLGFGQDTTGEIYVLTTTNVGPTGTTGQVWKIVPAP